MLTIKGLGYFQCSAAAHERTSKSGDSLPSI